MKNSKFADLHLHTVHSDGTEKPAFVVRKLAEKGYACIAITDHDTCAGVEEAAEEAKRIGVELIPGVEISAHDGEKSVHILGYFMDMQSEALGSVVSNNKDGRFGRMVRMVEKLNQIGYPVDFDELLGFIGEATVGRALLAKFLVKKGYFRNTDEVFTKILGDGKAVYEPVHKFTPEDIINLVHTAGGVASLAHPGFSGLDEEIARFADAGLDAIEVYSSQHTSAMVRRYAAIAEKHGLLVTGGSDYHGEGMYGRSLGSIKLTYDHVERLKERATRSAANRGMEVYKV